MSYEKIILFKMKKFLFGGRDPVTEPVWWLLVCPVCGKTVLAPPGGGVIHVAKDHTTAYVVDSEGITWKEAREIVNVDDIIGLGLIITEGETTDKADWKVHKNFVKILDAMADVKMKGRDNYLEGKKRKC